MKIFGRLLLLALLTGAGSLLLAELVRPLDAGDGGVSQLAAPSPAASQVDVRDGSDEALLTSALPATTGTSSYLATAASDNKEVLDGKEVLDAKDYKEALPEVGEGKEALPPVAEGPIGGPGALGPNGIGGPGLSKPPRVSPPALPPGTDVTTPP